MKNRGWALGGLASLGILIGIVTFQVTSSPRAGVGSEPTAARSPGELRADEQVLADSGLTRAEVESSEEGGGPASAASADDPSSHLDQVGDASEGFPVAWTTLEQVSQTFLTGDPDLAGFDRLVGEMAGRALVLPESIVVDGESGVCTGRLQLGEGLPEGEFEIDGDRYRVALTMGAGGNDGGAMVLRTLDVHFEADSAGITSASSTLQFHPDTRRRSSEFIDQGEEKYAGWAVRQAADGNVKVEPIAMRAAADGVSWEIGKPNALSPHPAPWAAGIGAAQSLYQKLSAVGK